MSAIRHPIACSLFTVRVCPYEGAPASTEGQGTRYGGYGLGGEFVDALQLAGFGGSGFLAMTAMETAASFEARLAPSSYPTHLRPCEIAGTAGGRHPVTGPGWDLTLQERHGEHKTGGSRGQRKRIK
jgi:hypothetical protein